MTTFENDEEVMDLIKKSEAWPKWNMFSMAEKQNAIDIASNIIKSRIEKGGAGSRGGKVIGTTKSGKPIYAGGDHAENHASFSRKDHQDAAEHHLKASKKAQLAGKKTGSREEKEKHMNKEMFHSSAQHFHNKAEDHMGQTKDHMNHPDVKNALSDVHEDHAAMVSGKG